MTTAGCGDDGPADAGATATELCATVQAWSDAVVDVVRDFRLASRELDPAGRRARYAASFVDQRALHQRLAAALATLALDAAVRDRLEGALAAVDTTVTDDAAEAAALPDDAYAVRGVRNGSLVTGTEKAKAVVFNTLADLAADPATGIPRGCGRRGALDLSPSVTFPA